VRWAGLLHHRLHVRQRISDEHRIVLTDEPPPPEPGGPAWGRFLLRLAAIVWLPLSVLLALVVFGGNPCGPAVIPLLLAMIPLPLAGVIALVCAANTTGCRQRWSLQVVVVVAVLWAAVTVVAAAIPGRPDCDANFLGGSAVQPQFASASA
jgi:hypothetical protein